LIAVLTAFIAGCYTTEQQGDATVVTYSGKVLLTLTAGTIIGIIVGLIMYRRENTHDKGVWVFGIAALFGIFVLPGIFKDEVRIDDQGIHQRTGFWFMPNRKGFDFDEVASISLREIRKRRTTETQWTLHLRNGGTRTLDPGDLWDYCSEEIAAALAQKGIPVDVAL
jgi:hypothetical protein